MSYGWAHGREPAEFHCSWDLVIYSEFASTGVMSSRPSCSACGIYLTRGS